MVTHVNAKVDIIIKGYQIAKHVVLSVINVLD